MADRPDPRELCHAKRVGVALLVAGAALVAAGAFYYFDGRSTPSAASNSPRLDREWIDVQAKYWPAARPRRPVPPPARPDPAPLHGLPASLGLATAGIVLGAGGLALFVAAQLSRRRLRPTP